MTSKSPLTEALKTLLPKKEKQKINVCNYCGTPLIFTFIMPYKEWFCINCGVGYDFLGRNETEANPELKAKKVVIDAVFNAIYKYHLPFDNAYKRKRCKKCLTTDEYHSAHLTKQEKLRNEVARKILKKLEGVFED